MIERLVDKSRSEPAREGTADALARCIRPIEREEFLRTYWERQPLLAAHAGADGFEDLLSAEDIERLICSDGLRFPAFRLVKAGERLRPADYTEDIPWRPSGFTGAIDTERVLDEFERGATVVLQALHLNWAPVARFCRDLETSLGHPVQANAYFTPRASQGLPVHHDTHDVFVLQVAGEKRWLVYDPALELPLKHQRYSAELGEPGNVVLETTLGPGDTLYLPRGWLHQAVTSGTDSLHLTIGVSPYTWMDALRAALEACANEVEFRRSVPDHAALPDRLLGELRARLEPVEVKRRKRVRFLETRRPILDGQLTQLRALDGLSLQTRVERRRTVIAHLGTGSASARLTFAGKELVFPARVATELEFVATTAEPFCPSDVPGALDDDGRLILIRRLVREGFLMLSRPVEPGASPSRTDGGIAT